MIYTNTFIADIDLNPLDFVQQGSDRPSDNYPSQSESEWIEECVRPNFKKQFEQGIEFEMGKWVPNTKKTSGRFIKLPITIGRARTVRDLFRKGSDYTWEAEEERVLVGIRFLIPQSRGKGKDIKSEGIDPADWQVSTRTRSPSTQASPLPSDWNTTGTSRTESPSAARLSPFFLLDWNTSMTSRTESPSIAGPSSSRKRPRAQSQASTSSAQGDQDQGQGKEVASRARNARAGLRQNPKKSVRKD